MARQFKHSLPGDEFAEPGHILKIKETKGVLDKLIELGNILHKLIEAAKAGDPLAKETLTVYIETLRAANNPMCVYQDLDETVVNKLLKDAGLTK